jgi:hypothetical protein
VFDTKSSWPASHGPLYHPRRPAHGVPPILAGIVDVPSYFDPATSIVATGDPEHSFLLHKVDHTLKCSLPECAAAQDCGSPDPLPANTRTFIRLWIAQGAKND